MDRRRQIRMSEAEVAAFLEEQRPVICATVGPGGRPHLAALWFLPTDGRLDCWTYAASQKARNLERALRGTLLTEAGTAYQELRGVSVECDAELVRDPGQVLDLGVALAVRYGAAPGPTFGPAWPPRRPSGSASVSTRPGCRAGITASSADPGQPRRDEAIAASTLGRARAQEVSAAKRGIRSPVTSAGRLVTNHSGLGQGRNEPRPTVRSTWPGSSSRALWTMPTPLPTSGPSGPPNAPTVAPGL